MLVAVLSLKSTKVKPSRPIVSNLIKMVRVVKTLLRWATIHVAVETRTSGNNVLANNDSVNDLMFLRRTRCERVPSFLEFRLVAFEV